MRHVGAHRVAEVHAAFHARAGTGAFAAGLEPSDVLHQGARGRELGSVVPKHVPTPEEKSFVDKLKDFFGG